MVTFLGRNSYLFELADPTVKLIPAPFLPLCPACEAPNQQQQLRKCSPSSGHPLAGSSVKCCVALFAVAVSLSIWLWLWPHQCFIHFPHASDQFI